jgi:cytochrome c peroxidase
MVFPNFEIQEVLKQEQRDLTRFDLDFDLPEHFLPEFPPAIYLTTRPDLGDVSKGKLVTIDKFYDLFNGILNPKQIEGLRLLLTPFPQQQFNQTDDRRSVKASRGVRALIVTRTVEPTVRSIWSETFVLRNSGIGSKRPHYAVLTSSGSSVRNGL